MSDGQDREYICIDLKSFYASVECVERGLDPMNTNLVVADPERGDKTICLAVSPSMKKLGVKNRCRVFEIPGNIDYIMAEPRMQKYIDYAADIYGLYLRYVAKEDIHVYSIDEVFMDVTPYLGVYGMTSREIAVMLMDRVYREIGIRATCGVGTNLYLAKIALDITAKHSPDFIGYLNEDLYRKTLWQHKPLTDFWRIGKGTARRLANIGIFTMEDLANTSPKVIYDIFGIDGELLIDHAFGREPVTIEHIREYKPKQTGISSGQVLMRDYSFDEGRLVLREMAEQLCLDMGARGMATSSVTVRVGYSDYFHGGGVGGTASLPFETNLESRVIPAVLEVYDNMVPREGLVRRFSISCNNMFLRRRKGSCLYLTISKHMLNAETRIFKIQFWQ